jgi:hypothetical protein
MRTLFAIRYEAADVTAAFYPKRTLAFDASDESLSWFWSAGSEAFRS